MEQQTLSVETRQETGKGISRRLRRAGKLPGVLYGLGKSSPVAVDPKSIFNALITEGGRNRIFTLSGTEMNGKAAMIKDYQVDPVSRNLVHVDLLEIDVTKKIQVTVKITFTGKSVGVAEGGVLNYIAREIDVTCLPNQIPTHLDVDVTNLKIGDSLHLDEVTLPEGVEKALHSNPTLVTVVPPTKEEEAAPSLAPTAEPEVITAKKEAPAEGEAGAEKKDEKKK